MFAYALNSVIHHIYTNRDRTEEFRQGNYKIFADFELSDRERRALAERDFVALWSLDVHPVVLFHLSAVLNPREWYLENVVPKIDGIPNKFYDFYRPPISSTSV